MAKYHLVRNFSERFSEKETNDCCICYHFVVLFNNSIIINQGETLWQKK